MENKTIRGAYVGRLNPIHLGHQAVIGQMLNDVGPENSLLILGSSTHPQSLRHFFSLRERSALVRGIYPTLRIVGLPDYDTDEDWLFALDQILVHGGHDPSQTIFYGGCIEDIEFFRHAGRKTEIPGQSPGFYIRA